ncbi:ABC transporter substrate-binding protein [Roseburia sp. MUC/MUC-530-WT-4D]|uniref:ABC transporter substrate-binding protein n=1 Tax=Roseburia porci TaxID=2605790 RepID=A0A6L5YPS5_9FIRM|nr:ABC transporter substrate-binding protein [Roseburia porci]MST74197.1 ABC transporter substrate-binding protein [Roseburia porci]
MKKMRQMLAILMAGTMVAGLATGCGNGKNDGTESGSKASSDTPLVIASQDMSEKFSEFFAASVPDQQVADMTAAYLLENDRAGELIMNGIDGETKEYNGTDYTYTGIADCNITENADGTVDYDFTLRDDVKFSDGEPLTADDVIFTYYVFCDPSYDGGASIGSLPIVGLDAYQSGSEVLYKYLLEKGADNTDFSVVTEDQQKQFFDTDLPKAGEEFAQSIVDYCLANLDASDAKNDIAFSMENYGYGATNDDGTFSSAYTGKTWTLEGDDVPTLADFWDDLCANPKYEGDILAMADAEKASTTLADCFDDSYKAAVQTGDSADHIEGIKKTGDYSVKITLSTVDATALAQLGKTPVQPMHYYGDASAYDYDNNQFGFTKGDLSSIREKTSTPMGAGPYKFVKYENKTVYLEANENYWRGEPKTKNIQFKTTSEADMVPGVVQGTVDISSPSLSKAALEQICSENSNGEENGDTLSLTKTDYNGYGYIGMNSKNVCVGGDNASEQSKDLRKAIATVLAVYRDVAIDSYYGDAASVINYPISNTSWAAPQKSDADYKVAFSTDVNGNPIYTDGMSEDEKYDAALQAALGYFEAAGYTVEDGKLTAAPEGAKLEYELMIGGGGNGDHPSFAVVTAASEALAKIGFKLDINDLADSSILWNATEAGTAEIWCAAWSATLDPDMYQVYDSNGGSAYMYEINSPELDQMVEDARTNTDQTYRKAVYKEALDFIVDFAVEIPVYQRQEATLYSTERVNMDSVTPDQTTYYTWLNEVQNLELN